MVLTTTSFHLFGITPPICTPSLIRNLRTAFAHPAQRKFSPLTHLDKGCRFGHPFVGISEKYFLPFTYLQWEQCFGHPNHQKIFTPLLIPTGKAQMHTLFERKFLIPSLICNGKGYFLSLFAKIPLTYLEWENVFGNPKSKIFLTNSHRDTPIHKGVLKNRHKKRRLSFDKRQTNC